MSSSNTNNKVKRKTFCDELCYFSLCRCFKKEAKNEAIVELTFDDDYSEIPLFDFNGYEAYVRIVDVYDGDTFTGCFKYNNCIMKYKFRCLGYDSPEMKPLKSIKNRDEVIKSAKEAKEKFKELTKCDSELVFIKFGKFDKYGRILGTIYNNDKLDINQEMIKLGHGYSYDGGTKRSS